MMLFINYHGIQVPLGCVSIFITGEFIRRSEDLFQTMLVSSSRPVGKYTYRTRSKHKLNYFGEKSKENRFGAQPTKKWNYFFKY